MWENANFYLTFYKLNLLTWTNDSFQWHLLLESRLENRINSTIRATFITLNRCRGAQFRIPCLQQHMWKNNSHMVSLKVTNFDKLKGGGKHLWQFFFKSTISAKLRFNIASHEVLIFRTFKVRKNYSVLINASHKVNGLWW